MAQQQSQSQPTSAQSAIFGMPSDPQSAPDTPSEIPGTPTSTHTSLSGISTTAMKDGQRGGHVPPLALDGSYSRGIGGNSQRLGHQHNPSTNSLEAERADRISRLTGLSGVSTLRPTYGPNRGSAASITSGGGGGGSVGNNNSNRFSGSGVFVTTPASTSGGNNLASLGLLSNMVVPGALTPAYFDAHGQPVAITKMSTVGTASATDSISGRTLDDNSTADGDTMTEDGDNSDNNSSAASDIKSMGTNYHYSNSRRGEGDATMMDDDNDNTNQSVGGYEDRMSDDDGAASLVGFGEGAGSTVSGPIYRRRPLPPPTGSSAGAMAANNMYNNLYNNVYSTHNPTSSINSTSNSNGPMSAWGLLERTNSGLSEMAVMGSTTGSAAGRRADFVRSAHEPANGASASAASPLAATAPAHMALDDVFVDSPTNGSIQAHPSAMRETQRPRSHQQQQQSQYSYGVSRDREQLLQDVNGYIDGLEPVPIRFGATGPGNSGNSGNGSGSGNNGPTERYVFEKRW